MAKRSESDRAPAYELDRENRERVVGWYQHPTRPREHRFWDGSAWTDWTDRSDGGRAVPSTLRLRALRRVPSGAGGTVPQPRDGTAARRPVDDGTGR